MSVQKIHHKLKSVFMRTDIFILVYTPVFIALIAFLAWYFLADKIFSGEIPELYSSFVTILCALIASLGGFVQILRQESPGLLGVSFRGILPVLSGILWVAFCLFVSFFLIYWSIFENTYH